MLALARIRGAWSSRTAGFRRALLVGLVGFVGVLGAWSWHAATWMDPSGIAAAASVPRLAIPALLLLLLLMVLVLLVDLRWRPVLAQIVRTGQVAIAAPAHGFSPQEE